MNAQPMIAELAISTLMVSATVLLHYVGILSLDRVLRLEVADEERRHLSPWSVRGIVYPLVLVLGLFFLHGIEIWLYAFLYEVVGAIHTLRTAVYFSTMTYSSVGFSDHYIREDWRIVAAIEGINGLLLIGWSTAFFVTFMNRMMR